MAKKRDEDAFVSTFVHLAIVLRRRLDSLSRQCAIVSSATCGLREIATFGSVSAQVVVSAARGAQPAKGDLWGAFCRWVPASSEGASKASSEWFVKAPKRERGWYPRSIGWLHSLKLAALDRREDLTAICQRPACYQVL